MQPKFSEKEMQILLALSKAVKNKRLEKAKSQRVLADEYEIHKSMFSRYENCESEPKLFSLWRVANALDIKPSELFYLIEKELVDNIVLIDE